MGVVKPTEPAEWPRLSETLTRPKHPDVCQSCGWLGVPDALAKGLPKSILLRRWRECDGHDMPTPTVVVLCPDCSGRLIEPHPRLYVELEWCEPDPGSMPMCGPCRNRDGTGCRFSLAHGGGGVILEVPGRLGRIHVYYGGGKGAWLNPYPEWPRGCSRFVPQGGSDGSGGGDDGTGPVLPGQ